jgi:xanthine dehydrogenase YagT iron-sulfur-binding subunit
MSDEQQPDQTPSADLDQLLIFGDPATRRTFLKQVAGTSAAIALSAKLPGAAAEAAAAGPAAAATAVTSAATDIIDVRFTLNGREVTVRVDPRTTLLDALRERLFLTGTKKGCDHGQCGACTVLVNGRRINSCLSLAVTHEGDKVTTIEGLAQGDELHPVQAAFLEHDGFQCGYCTPGQICSAVALLQEGHAGSDAEVREWMSGNLCRCGAYTNIVAAIRAAKEKAPTA